MKIDELRTEQIKEFPFEEKLATYTFTESFGNTIKSTTVRTNSMDEIFSENMDFLKYIGFTDEMLLDALDNYQKGFI